MSQQVLPHPEIIQAFEKIYSSSSDAVSSANAVSELGIQNLKHLNHKYLAIGYFIAADIYKQNRDPVEFFEKNDDILLTSYPGEKMEYQVYQKRSVYDLLKSCFSFTEFQHEKIIHHLKHLLSYIRMFLLYMTKKIDFKNEVLIFMTEQDDDEDEYEYSDEEDEYEFEEEDEDY